MYSSAYVWAKVLIYLEEQLSAITVSSWFDDAEVVELNDEHLILYSPSDFRQEIIRRRCTVHIQDALKEIFNSNAKVIVFNDEQLAQHRSGGKKNTSLEFAPQFSFENFVVGPSNRFAHGAAIAVANSPGDIYNPLFIYGPPGVGKTHLLYAIAHTIHREHPDYRIVYIRGDAFTNELIRAIREGKNQEFRDKYRSADVFLMDDVQFIAGRDSTQEEMFHTFNNLYEEKKQIVFTSDRPPKEMLRLEDRLKTRFEWGLMADIQPPDYETRMAIIKNKAKSLGLQLGDDVCDYIAVTVTNNVRQIEGTVKKIMAYHNLTGMELNLPNVSRAIDDMFKSEGSAVPTPSLIISQVSKFYAIDETILRGTKKNKNTAEARQIAMYLIRQLTNLSLPDIGQEFSRDHSTVLHSIRKIEVALKGGNQQLSDNIRDITANINSCL